MFGANNNPFGQTSSSPFGTTQSVFGQTSNVSNNPFAPKPFGTPTTPFGAQTGSSMFGGTSTGMFGAPQTSSFPTTTGFGVTSSPAFGTSTTPAFGTSTTPAFGASSTPAFGSSTPAFGGSTFGQKPFGGFGSTAQTSPFGSTTQQSQPAFGSGLFGSTTPFGGSSQPAFGAPSTPAFGATTASAFGATTTSPAFGVTTTTPAFGATSTTPAFGSTSSQPFGSTGGAFGVSNSPLNFGTGGTFGTSTTPPFGASTSGFGLSSTSTFLTPSTGSSFTFSTAPSQSTSSFTSSPFGTTTSAFSSQSSPFATQPTTPAFAVQPGVVGQRGGSRVTPYTETIEAESTGVQGKLQSISAMPVYKDKSHEELRWEDYQNGDKGGPRPSVPSPGFNLPTSQLNSFATSTAFGPTSTNVFSPSPNPFAPKTPSTLTPQPSSNPFQPSTSASLFQNNTAPSLFSTSSAPTFNSTPSLFNSTTSQATFTPFVSTSTSLSFPSTTPSLAQTSSAFGPATTPSTVQNSFFNPTFSFSTQPLTTPSIQPSQPAPFQVSQPVQSTSNFFNSGQTQTAGTSAFSTMSSFFSPSNPVQLSAAQGSVAVQPVPATNPFGTLPAMPQMSIGRAGTSPSVQYGISSMPVVEKPAPVRISSLLTSRHLSQRRIRLPARKYYPKHDGPKVPFFSDEEEAPSTPKADALFIPRENPRALVIRPMDQWPSRPIAEKASPLKDASVPVHENGKISESNDARLLNGSDAGDKNVNSAEDGVIKEQVPHLKLNHESNGVHEDHSTQKEESYMTLSGHRAGEAAIVYEHGADIEALMPKLRRSDYYTEPRIQELAAKERAKPGFCRHVKDFVVGRHGYGSIRFLGETDVRRLDLESLVQFNNREVIVYMDDSKKPPIGQGLNKPAEVTLLNIKCFDKKTGRQFTEGPKIEKYKEMLKRKAEDQGAEFVSYDAVKGEWKFKVSHFSKYKLEDEEEDWDVQADSFVVL